MATTVQTIITVKFNPNVSSGLGNISLNLGHSLNWASGVAVSQADKVYTKDASVVSGSPNTYDLAGSLLMVDGSTASFARIKAIYIRHLGTPGTDDAKYLKIGGGSNPFISWLLATGDGVNVYAGGELLLTNPTAGGYPVTGGTGDILQIDSASGTANYIIGLVGAST